MNYQRELEIALDGVNQAGQAILEDYAQFKVVPDAPADITTQTDRRAQEIILKCLKRAFPADGLCAEEATETLGRAKDVSLPVQNPTRLWIIDPIDGTRGFARKTGEFSVMVGLVDQGEIAIGVVSEPARGRLTYAVRGGGCWRRDTGSAATEPCRVTTVSSLPAATLTQSHSRESDRASPQLAALRPAKIIETYSAGIKLALVARGEADVYLNTYDRYHDWDICAGQILVTEAGGRVTNLQGQSPLYGLPGAVQQYGLLATNGVLHDAALAALASGAASARR
jgi:3'(2'), 5'-bisphosphate nucleotidase